MSGLQSVLVLDHDLRTLDVLAFAFERDGYTVFRAHELDLATALAQNEQPQVVVQNLGGNHAAGIQLCAAVRQRPEFEGIPILVIGDGAPRDDLLNVGASTHLSRPVYLRDVVTIARVLVKLAPRPDAGNRLCLDAQVAEYGLYFMMRAVAAAGLSAVLDVGRQGRRGEVLFAAGDIVAAQLGGLTGLTALHAMLLWDHGALNLRLTEVARVRRIANTSEETLADCERFLRDFQAAAAPIGAPDMVLEQDLPSVAAHIAHIPAQVAPVLRLFDGHRTLAAVAADSPFAAFDSLRIAGRLYDMGAIRPVGAPRTAEEVVRGEILARGVGATADNHPPTKVVFQREDTTLAQRLEAVLADEAPIPLATPRLRAADDSAAQRDEAAGAAPEPAAAPPPPVGASAAPRDAGAAAEEDGFVTPPTEIPTVSFDFRRASPSRAMTPPAEVAPPAAFNYPPGPPAAFDFPSPAPPVGDPLAGGGAPPPDPPAAFNFPPPAPPPVGDPLAGGGAPPPDPPAAFNFPPPAPPPVGDPLAGGGAPPPDPPAAFKLPPPAPPVGDPLPGGGAPPPGPPAAFNFPPASSSPSADPTPVAAMPAPAPPAAVPAPPAVVVAWPAAVAAPSETPVVAATRPLAPPPDPAAGLSPALAPTETFSALEEEFFARAHEHLAQESKPDTFEDLEEPTSAPMESRAFGDSGMLPIGPRSESPKTPAAAAAPPPKKKHRTRRRR